MPRAGVIVALVALTLVPLCAPAPASASAPPTPEGKIKADIVFNLATVVTWPGVAEAGAAFGIGMLGHDDSDPDFAHLVGKDVRHLPLALRNLLPDDAAADVQVVYVSRSESAQWPRILARLHGRPVLTVSEMDDFCESGGMVQLRRDRHAIVLRVNRQAVDRAGLRLSSQLLKVAEVVEGGD